MSCRMLEIFVSKIKGSDKTGNGSFEFPYSTFKPLKENGIQLNNTTIFYANNSEYHKIEPKDIEINKFELEDIETKLPETEVKNYKINEIYKLANHNIKVYGWISTIRRQGKNLMFIIIRDGTGFLQCVLFKELCHAGANLTPESAVLLSGKVSALPEGKSAPGNVELSVTSLIIVSTAPPGGMDTVINEESSVDTLLNNRHLQLRTTTMINIMKVRSVALLAFREHYKSKNYYEVTPPTLVQTQCEGGSTLFKFNYFGETAFLTQSSQLYLETVIPALGNVFCIAQSYRAEQSKTRRHLAEYTHIEAEMPFINFTDLLEYLEDLVCDVLNRILASEVREIVLQLNPGLKPFKRPFKRMLYTEALEFLRQNGITKDEGSFYSFGDDIPEAPERKMTDQIGEPIFLMKFPADLKAFYMKKDEDRKLTESVDLLLPGVGEVIGGSMRMSDEKELLEAYKKEGVDPSPYYWYTDQRKFGSCEHGGYGLGFERYLTWLMNRHHIRDVVLYPRFVGRCTP